MIPGAIISKKEPETRITNEKCLLLPIGVENNVEKCFYTSKYK